MATIKSYTDLSQSKVLAEILPLESADMVYVHTVDLEGDEHYDIDFPTPSDLPIQQEIMFPQEEFTKPEDGEYSIEDVLKLFS